MHIDSRRGEPSKAFSLIDVSRDSGSNVTLLHPHLAKHRLHKTLTREGMYIDSRLEHCSNALSPIDETIEFGAKVAKRRLLQE
jgi:hypothetical protein